MPNLSIDELLVDPDFTSYLVLIQTRTQIGANGRGEVFKATSRFIGIVGPVRASELQRAPEGMNTSGALTVISQQKLTSGNAETGEQPDQVQWQNNLYVVRQVDDYSEYGAGFVQAMLERQGINQ